MKINKCQALCSSDYKFGKPCPNFASVKFKDGLMLCGRHASKQLLAIAIENKEIKIIRRPQTLIFSKIFTKLNITNNE